jgi:N,N'-diacetyllegionaminate synthase
MNKNKTFIIAEAGVNHNGSLKLAKKLIQIAKYSGVDAVKFQTFKAQNLSTKNSPKAEYQKRTSNNKETQFQMLKKLEFTKKMHEECIKYCKKLDIIFLSSAFDVESLKYLKKLKLSIFKVPSGEITNYLYLKKLGSFNKKIFLSTGMSNLKEISLAIKTLIKFGTLKSNITLLQCNTEYPTPFKDANLKAILSLKKNFKLDVGYSDHTESIEASLAAVALGATVIEKHFTLSKRLEGPDHVASLEPKELKNLVTKIRNIEISLGDGKKKVSKSEKKNLKIVRKSIVAVKDIKKGEVFTEYNLTSKRPGNGLSPFLIKKLVGTKSTKSYTKDQQIK